MQIAAGNLTQPTTTLSKQTLSKQTLAKQTLEPTASSSQAAAPRDNIGKTERDPDELKDVFTQFVGQTFFSQLIKSARSGMQESAYFHGGQGEKVFQAQLDQVFAEEMTEATGEQVADPMFELMMLPKQR